MPNPIRGKMLRKVFILSLLLLGLPIAVHGLQPNYAESFKRELYVIVDRHPKYCWTGASNEKEGLDCSGYMYLAGKRAAMPIKRVTARDMRLGLGGWIGKDTSLEQASELNIIWWTWKNASHFRPDGHVGALINGRKSGLLEVTDSGESHGVTIHKLYGSYFSDISAIREIDMLRGQSETRDRR
jgi:hypothetical protein